MAPRYPYAALLGKYQSTEGNGADENLLKKKKNQRDARSFGEPESRKKFQ